MKKFNPLSILLIALLALTSNAHAQIPTGYYDNALNQTGDDLKDSLHNIIKGHTKFSYSSSNTDVWDILKVADRDPNDSTKVIGIYSGFSMDAAGEYNSGSGWNREHVWAKSRGNFGTTQGAGTDAHHLRAADISTNSARNNRNFDYADTYYNDASGYYSGATDSKTSSTDWIWEPRDEVKGDIARMIFYMATRYEGDGNEPDLELTENHLNNSDQSPLHSKLSVLLEWHQNDPVSPEEELRNNVIYSYQNNRNPFIDHPEFVCDIYPCVTTTTSELFISEYIEGSSYNKAIEIANYIGYHEFGTSTKTSIVALETPKEIVEETILSVYPNPAQFELHYSINDNVISLNVFDVQGRLQNVFVDMNSNTLDVSNLSQGVYVIAIQTENGIQTSQFVKQ